jgi:glycosyltransferase involved in cell wall biosynthesis
VDAGRGAALKVVLSVDPIKFPLTGIGRYTYELARGLQQASLEDLQFLSGSRLQSILPLPDDARPMAKASAWKEQAQKSRLAVALYRVLNPWLKGRALRGLEDHVYHGPNYYLPPFAGRSVVTMHDLSPYLWPQSHPPERVRYMKAEIRLSLKRATALITDTEFTRQEVAKFFAWPLNRIHAVPLASAAEFLPRTEDDLVPVLRPVGLAPCGYTLFTGTVEPRKNILVLLDAYARLPAAMRARWPLVVAGYRGWSSEELHARIEEAQREGWLRYLGFVPHEVLPPLMAGARLFAYPSLYEGFGLPVLEAMASGVPVVCSNASTLPEVAGDAAAFHEPADVDALVKLLQLGLEDEMWRNRARAAGLAQAAKFSWERCTRKTLDVYGAVLNA